MKNTRDSMEEQRISMEWGIPLEIEIDGIGAELRGVLIGVDPGHCLMIKAPVKDLSTRDELSEGREVTVRYVAKEGVVECRSRLISVLSHPVEAFFIEYPPTLEHYDRRSEARLPSSIPAEIQAKEGEVHGTIMDISGKGCRVVLKTLDQEVPLVAVDEELMLTWRAPDLEEKRFASGQVRSLSMDARKIALGIEFDKVYPQMVGRLEAIFAAIPEDREVDLGDMDRLIGGMIESLEKGDSLFRWEMQGRYTPTSLERHSVNVTIVALRMGMHLEYDREQLLSLGWVSLLHDIGRARMSDAVWEKAGPLSAEEWSGLHRHPKVGADLLRGMVGETRSWLSDVVLQHHERMDGSGYPLGLRGDGVHEMAYIVGLADMYEAMTHRRPYRDGVSSSRALQELKQRHGKGFPGRLMQALERVLPAELRLYADPMSDKGDQIEREWRRG